MDWAEDAPGPGKQTSGHAGLFPLLQLLNDKIQLKAGTCNLYHEEWFFMWRTLDVMDVRVDWWTVAVGDHTLPRLLEGYGEHTDELEQI